MRGNHIDEKTINIPERVKKKKRFSGNWKRTLFIYGGLAWTLLHFFVFWFCMNIGTLYNSFFKEVQGGGMDWNGLNAYKDVWMYLTGQKSNGVLSWVSLPNTFSLLGLGILINMPLTLLFSYMLYKQVAGHKIFRIGMYVPCVLSTVILCLFYRIMVSGTSNYKSLFSILERFGYSNQDIIQNGVLANGDTAWKAVLVFSVWTGVNGNIIYFSSAMARLPDSVLESAELDGATQMRQFISIIIPMIWPVMTTMSITLISGAFAWFQPVQIMIGEGMAATTKTSTLAWMIIDQTTKGGAVSGFPAALGVTIAIFGGTLILSFKAIMEKVFSEVEY